MAKPLFWVLFILLLTIALPVQAAEDNRYKEPYTGQTQISCMGESIRIPAIPYDTDHYPSKGLVLAYDEENCTPESFLVSLEAKANCDSEWCILGQFATFPQKDTGSLGGTLLGAMFDQAIAVSIKNTDNAFFVPLKCRTCERRKLIWWSHQDTQVSILSTNLLNSAETIAALSKAAEAYTTGVAP